MKDANADISNSPISNFDKPDISEFINSAARAATEGNHGAASDFIRKAISLDPSNASLWHTLGIELSKTIGGLEESSKCFARANDLRENPADNDAAGEKILSSSYIHNEKNFWNPYTYIAFIVAAFMILVFIAMTFASLGIIVLTVAFFIMLFEDHREILDAGFWGPYLGCFIVMPACLFLLRPIERLLKKCHEKTCAQMTVRRKNIEITHGKGVIIFNISRISRVERKREESRDSDSITLFGLDGKVLFTAVDVKNSCEIKTAIETAIRSGNDSANIIS